MQSPVWIFLVLLGVFEVSRCAAQQREPETLLVPLDSSLLSVDTTEAVPQVIASPTLEYPAIAKRAGIEGKVEVRALVDAQGNVTDVKAIKSDNDLLTAGALDVVRRQKFRPAVRRRKPVPYWITQTVRFKLLRSP